MKNNVSVIIPAYNAEKSIQKCLDSLMNQDYTGDYEVIVVDDGSTDSTSSILSRYATVRLIKQKNAGPADARNRGAAKAKGDIILFTDADCIPEYNWITEMVKPFKSNPDIVGVRGKYRTEQKEIVAKFVQIEYEDKYSYIQKDKYVDFIDTYSAGFKKDVFINMKGYDTEFPVACAEDIELSYRLSNKGYKMVFNPDAIVCHTHPDKLSDYLKKKYKFAYWRVVALKKNPNKVIKDSYTPQLMKMQLFFPPTIFGGIILSPINKSFLYLSLLLLVLFLITTIPFTVKACKRDLKVGLLSPFLLFFRSIAHFLGVLLGTFYVIKQKW